MIVPPDDDGLNRLLMRTADEYLKFQEMDKEEGLDVEDHEEEAEEEDDESQSKTPKKRTGGVVLTAEDMPLRKDGIPRLLTEREIPPFIRNYKEREKEILPEKRQRTVKASYMVLTEEEFVEAADAGDLDERVERRMEKMRMICEFVPCCELLMRC